MKDALQDPRFKNVHGIRSRLLILTITLLIIPLAGISLFSYVVGRNQIQERILMTLGKMAQDTADKIDLL
ncbi:MAG TPA: hypothetical protein VLL97_04740, partial [Acidobacteriota bacterium]|nr:hypothetical protein [Acidobacteriota bacterium]